jgi:1A family penicillin-binding protein
MKLTKHFQGWKNKLLIAGTLCLVLLGCLFIWAATFRVPDLSDLATRKVVQSTKIYDRTGQTLLYDMSQNVKRTLIPFEDISPYIKNATLAIEDKNFYTHGGVDLTSILRALIVDITTLSSSQGGSTITQQVVKNTILTGDKSITRKLKEFILAIKLEKVLNKDQILNLYLNEIPYGGSIYGVEEASQSFFAKSAKNDTLTESVYLAAMENAPTYYSPYGPNLDKLEARKNLVLKEMFNNGFISQTDLDKSTKETVTFKPKTDSSGIKAPHFVFFVIDQLVKKYGEDVLNTGGLKVTTTLDYSIQSKAEILAKKYGISNQKNFNADNDAIVAIDPKTGDILSMVGSRDYFDQTINGNFNVATAHRQPGSTFKPFVYSALFNKGYTPSTILFDVPTQFNPSCAPNNATDDSTRSANGCYAPVDYDGLYRGPMTVRDALAQSINIPAVEALYLAGIQNSINTATAMGVSGLATPDQYGLSLVLGGGEVTPLDMTSAYSVFANDGIRNPYNAILEIQDENGQVIYEASPNPKRVLDEETARKISSILSDNVARTPGYGSNSVLYIANQDVAVKTGTTNDYKDAWIEGYTPNLAVGMWVGNNKNTPMDKKVAGYIVAPMWRDLIDEVLPTRPVESFIPPTLEEPTIKPILRGIWQGGVSNLIPTVNQSIETVSGGVHSILYWVDKDNPRGPIPSNPANDGQFKNWEYSVRTWVNTHFVSDGPITLPVSQNNFVTPTNTSTTTTSTQN